MTTTHPNSRKRRTDGLRTHETIVNAAADLVSLEGLDTLTIGSLADRLGISKSGLFAHFGSKEGLQLEAIEAARKRYVAVVLKPALKSPRGWKRVEALCARALDYTNKPEFPGGCFFVAAQAGARGAARSVRSAVSEHKDYFRRLLVRTIKDAQEVGEVTTAVDAEQIAYELAAVLDAVTWSVGTDRVKPDRRYAALAVGSILRRAKGAGRKKRSNS
jgi:AcrR family transcriptional regulator